MGTQRGFTVLELLVTVTIVGILSSLAVQTFSAYRNRAFEAHAMHYMRNWVHAQELYLQTYGKYADADEQLANVALKVLKVPTGKIGPYNFSIDSGTNQTTTWWGRAQPLRSGLRYFYIDQSGRLLSSMSGPPSPP
jgi:type IV pilus assembly protein PilE